MKRNRLNSGKYRHDELLRALCLLLLALFVWSGQKQYGIEKENGKLVRSGAVRGERTGSYTAVSEKKSLYRRKIALTFDDGPDPRYTPKLLDGLAERSVKVSFFLTGENAEKYPELVERMQREGHLIGNHTYSHLQLAGSNRDQFRSELIRTNEIIKEITGEEVVYVRPPYGSWDKSFEEELNMFPVLWSIDPLDWCTDNVSNIVKRVLSKTKENAIILMHDEYPSTVTAALQIVDVLLDEGYTFVTVDEILFD